MQTTGGTGSSDDPLFLELREQLERHRHRLLAGLPFPVLGLVAPVLSPAVLAGSQLTDDEWTAVTLAYGDPDSIAGPFAQVLSAPASEGPLGLDVALEDERLRLTERIGIREPSPEDVRFGEEPLTVDQQTLRALIRDEGTWWAARLRVRGTVVTLVTRGVPRSDVRLATVPDLAPFVRAADEELARLRAERTRTRPEELDLPPAHGMEAHRAVIRLGLGYAEGLRTAVTVGARHPVRTPAQREEHVRIWESATRAQMHFAGQSRAEATEAITSMVNQAMSLNESAPWFADPRLRDRALEELIRYTVFDSDVLSRPAQQAWQRVWMLRSPHALPERSGGLPVRGLDRHGQWLAEWQRWTETMR